MSLDVFIFIHYANVGRTSQRDVYLDLFDCTSVFYLYCTFYQFNIILEIKQTLKGKPSEIFTRFFIYRKLHHEWCRLIH